MPQDSGRLSSLSFGSWVYKYCQDLQLLKTGVYSVQKKAMQLCESNAALWEDIDCWFFQTTKKVNNDSFRFCACANFEKQRITAVQYIPADSLLPQVPICKGWPAKKVNIYSITYNIIVIIAMTELKSTDSSMLRYRSFYHWCSDMQLVREVKILSFPVYF